jgi:hypothetical protein
VSDLEHLTSVAAQLAARIRDDDPEANGRWLLAMVPDSRDWWLLCFVLAAMVPQDRTIQQLLAWTQPLAGGPDTPEAVAKRRRELDEALRGAPRSPTSHRTVAA